MAKAVATKPANPTTKPGRPPVRGIGAAPADTRCWLMKTEPESFAIADLARVKIEPWTGVRNYLARNHMRDMQVGDDVLFYHSSTAPAGVAGLAKVHRVGAIDRTQFDPTSPYFDPTSSPEEPRWDCVEVRHVRTFPEIVTLTSLRAEPRLAAMMVLQRGARLSVQPVREPEFAVICELAGVKSPVR